MIYISIHISISIYLIFHSTRKTQVAKLIQNTREYTTHNEQYLAIFPHEKIELQ